MNIKLFLFVSLLGIGVVLYAALKGKPDSANNFVDKELESSLQAFMDEFEKENEYLIQTIQQLQNELQLETAVNRERINELEAKIEQMSQSKGRNTAKKTEATPAIVFNEHYSRVVMMANEGRTPEQISKDTGIGMGEIQMILSLVKQGNTV